MILLGKQIIMQFMYNFKFEEAHMFIHLSGFLNTPKLSKFNIEEYANWVDMVIRTDLPDPSSVPDLHELVKRYQIHRHSKTCPKY